jgi:hypothetical protein
MSSTSFRVGALLLISALAACDNYDDDSYTGTPVEPVPARTVAMPPWPSSRSRR